MKRLLALLLIGCGPIEPGGTGGGSGGSGGGGGDPRAAFVGSWQGAYTTTVTIGGQTSNGQGATTWQLMNSSISSERVSWSTVACNYQAKVTTDSSLIVDPVNCSTQTTDAGCTVSLAISGGNGTRTGTSLSVTLSGSTIAQCPSGGPQSGTYTLRFDGSKQ